MLNTQIETLKDYIIQYNPYFNNGYTGVVLNEKTGMVHNNEPVFPMDTLGDYFYLRTEDGLRFDFNEQFRISDCIAPTGVTASMVLVACVNNADADKLLNNLTNTILAYTASNIRLRSAIFESDDVVLQELRKMQAESIDAALQRLKSSYTIVSIKFEISDRYNFQKPSCNVNPCKCS